MADIQKLQAIASQVRRDIVRQVSAAQSGHPGGSLGCTDLLVALYFEIMDHNPDFNMSGQGEDLFYLSNGHISPVFYSVLARSGYFPIEELATFRQINSRLQGHPATHEGLPGIRTASGSLGQGLSVAIGAALAKRLNKEDKLIYCLMGDGEQEEGQIWEAVMFAGHNKVDNLIAICDRNNQQIDGSLDDVLNMGDLGRKYAEFGWEVLRTDGNDMAELVATLEKAKAMTGNGKPIFIDMKTEMGKGVDYMEGTHKWHGKAPDAELTAKALAQLEETLGDY
ncbi:MAG: transketolase [Bacteroidota bacterium]